MAFVVEDGTGLANANAGASVAEVDAYHTDRGNADWTGTNTVKEQAIIKATDYIEQRFGYRFKGMPEFEGQALSFPRLYLYDRNGAVVEGVPTKYKYAIAEYAMRALTTDLYLEPTVDESGLVRTSFKEKVGPIEEAATYSNQTVIKTYPAADNYLRDYITGNLSQGRVIRG